MSIDENFLEQFFLQEPKNSLTLLSCAQLPIRQQKLGVLEHKWNDSLAATGVIFKVFFVGSMFPNGPNSHLVEPGEGKQAG